MEPLEPHVRHAQHSRSKAHQGDIANDGEAELEDKTRVDEADLGTSVNLRPDGPRVTAHRDEGQGTRLEGRPRTGHTRPRMAGAQRTCYA